MTTVNPSIWAHTCEKSKKIKHYQYSNHQTSEMERIGEMTKEYSEQLEESKWKADVSP